MVAIPLAILALAAGVYLLTYVKQFSLGGLYRNLSWLVILLSLAFIAFGVTRGVIHMRHMRQCEASGSCSMRESGACPYMKNGECNMKSGECSMKGGHGECKMDKGCGEGKMDCCKDHKEAAGSCTEMHGDGEKAACCKKGMAADSTGKK